MTRDWDPVSSRHARSSARWTAWTAALLEEIDQYLQLWREVEPARVVEEVAWNLRVSALTDEGWQRDLDLNLLSAGLRPVGTRPERRGGRGIARSSYGVVKSGRYVASEHRIRCTCSGVNPVMHASSVSSR